MSRVDNNIEEIIFQYRYIPTISIIDTILCKIEWRNLRSVTAWTQFHFLTVMPYYLFGLQKVIEILGRPNTQISIIFWLLVKEAN